MQINNAKLCPNHLQVSVLSINSCSAALIYFSAVISFVRRFKLVVLLSATRNKAIHYRCQFDWSTKPVKKLIFATFFSQDSQEPYFYSKDTQRLLGNLHICDVMVVNLCPSTLNGKTHIYSKVLICHYLSFTIIRYHLSSFAITVHHSLSLSIISIINHHWPSKTIIHYHRPSSTIIGHHLTSLTIIHYH